MIRRLGHCALALAPPSTPGRDKIFGWSIVRSDSTCEMHVMDPTVTWRPERQGHEDAHCFWGRYHNQEGKRP